MSATILITLLLAIPLLGSILIWISPSDFKISASLHIIGSVLMSIIAFSAVSLVIGGKTFFAYDRLLFIDPVGGVFITLIALVGLLIAFYAVPYMKWELEKKELNVKDIKLFFALYQLFIFTMLFSLVANNIALMWAAIEATTLSSVFMVALYKNKRATESGWKYIVICGVGLAFGLYATILMYGAGYAVLKNGYQAMLWSSLMLHAKELNPNALKLVFIIALIGFGTKAGLAPMHTWLPDVHSEGPSPTSAILSAILLKCAIAAIVRYYSVIGTSSVGFHFVEILCLIVGLLSIFIAAFFIIKQKDIKRMFAYHSVEHVGIIAAAFGIGGPLGIFAGLFHSLAHSLSKALAFCVSGNIIKIYDTRNMDKMGGLSKISPISAVLLGIAIFSLIGSPLLAIFVSEFMIVKAGIFMAKYFQIALFLLGVAIIFIAVLEHYNMVVFSKSRGKIVTNKIETSANLPLMALALLIFFFGVYEYQDWFCLLHNAVNIILGK